MGGRNVRSQLESDDVDPGTAGGTERYLYEEASIAW